MSEDPGEFAAKSIRWGETSDTFDTWAEAELARHHVLARPTQSGTEP